MRRTRGWTGLRNALIALGLAGCAVSGASAAALKTDPSIMSYSTAVQVDSTGITGANVISILPATNSGIQITGKDNLALGTFVIAANNGATTTYKNTPFSVTLNPISLGDNALTTEPIKITGVLNGTVTGNYHSTVEATFNNLSASSFKLGNGTANLSLVDNPKLLVPSSSNGGQTTIEAQLVSNNVAPPAVPEPSTVAMFLTTIGGLGLRRHVQNRRRMAAA
ncbi:PEP-CTERM sorting domain-containing protein [Aquisphaera insulae]|uniref:PEP-CTERM sorting domain-containing protein n=1 Tax=Aquisphaera insulae TaxID=2712864 RepID=UPI0013EBF132|nr:PEP-CTERM sorting domain-containing protein [Aquisphaera insulae]